MAIKELIYLNPKGPSNIFYREQRFEDLVPYIPADLSLIDALGLYVGENIELRGSLKALSDRIAKVDREKRELLITIGDLSCLLERERREKQDDLKIFVHPYEKEIGI